MFERTNDCLLVRCLSSFLYLFVCLGQSYRHFFFFLIIIYLFFVFASRFSPGLTRTELFYLPRLSRKVYGFYYYFILAKGDLSQYLHNAFKVFYPIGSLGIIFFHFFERFFYCLYNLTC